MNDNKMLCTVYRSARKQGAYLYVKQGDDLSQLPAALLAQLGELSQVMTLALHGQRKLANADVEKVMQELTDTGFYLQMPPVEPRRTSET